MAVTQVAEYKTSGGLVVAVANGTVAATGTTVNITFPTLTQVLKILSWSNSQTGTGTFAANEVKTIVIDSTTPNQVDVTLAAAVATSQTETVQVTVLGK
jgi:hypothetical protein